MAIYSFQNKGFWMAKGPGSLVDNEMAYDNSSRMDPKRPHHWFMDGTEAELFPNKKQAVEVPNPNSFSGLLNSNVSPWGSASSFHSVSGQFTERLFDSETSRTINFDDRNVPSVGMGNVNMARKVVDDSYGSDSSFGLAISQSLEDPRSGLNYGGIRKVKVSQVKDSENFLPGAVGHVYAREDNSSISAPHDYSKADDTCITMGLSFNRGDSNLIPMGDTFNAEDSNFISMGQPYSKGNDSNMSIGHTYKEDNSAMSIGQHLNNDDCNNTKIGHAFSKGDGGTISMGHSFKENDNAVAVGHLFGQDDSSCISIGQAFNNGSDSTTTNGPSYIKVDHNAVAMGHTYSKVDDKSLSMSHSFSKGENNIISFGGLNDDDDINPSGRLICSYDLLMGQSSGQISEPPTEKGLVGSNADALVNAAQITAFGETSSNKEEQKPNKKAPTNNFPSNVRSLLSTGMLDGVPVKYVAWSREKELRGIIKGSGYLCGCQSCNFSKAINAYEFERHAGCKTKHPNNHIYFENGKTIYGIVQELKSTPQNLLFEVIQTITGSPINQKSFRLWKGVAKHLCAITVFVVTFLLKFLWHKNFLSIESFLAATRELQRIYGKEEGKQLS
ncbi:hypothetical protein RJ640_024186 [Escallonia rubra]|uniref:Tify domain-containing protein n=1 Tax=Escallonia rubra TaxID=112253 RepID=A0AA88R736_9ASTE|nr:hypothetical protein RJ640_024186 [Escallonia rubra]